MPEIVILQLFEGPLKDLFIALDAIQLFICIELAALFFSRAWSDKRTWKINFSWGLIFAFFGSVVIFKVLDVFYIDPASLNPILINFRGFVPFISVVALLEYFLQKYQKTKYFFTIIGLSFGITNFFVTQPIGLILMWTYSLFLLIFGILFFKNLIQLSSGTVRKNVILFTFSFIMLIIGWIFTSRNSIENQLTAGLDIGIIGFVARIVQMSSFILMAIILLRLPIFFEVNWREKIRELFIIHNLKGVPLYHRTFKSQVAAPPQAISRDLVAGGMVGITSMLKEISQSSDELKIIDHGDLKILLEHGRNILIALLVEEEMFIHRDKLIHLQETIQTLYGKILAHWDGNLEYFDPLKSLVSEQFE